MALIFTFSQDVVGYPRSGRFGCRGASGAVRVQPPWGSNPRPQGCALKRAPWTVQRAPRTPNRSRAPRPLYAGPDPPQTTPNRSSPVRGDFPGDDDGPGPSVSVPYAQGAALFCRFPGLRGQPLTLSPTHAPEPTPPRLDCFRRWVSRRPVRFTGRDCAGRVPPGLPRAGPPPFLIFFFWTPPQVLE